jgi:hypothetical protein
LAFLQAIWGKADTRPLIIGALFGIVSFALGVSLGALTYIWRHLAFSGGERNWGGKTFDRAYWYIPLASIVCFVFGLIVTAIGGLWTVL